MPSLTHWYLQLIDGTSQKAQVLASGISRSLLRLTEKSVDDNVTVRVITVITLIYLPTQFVAVSTRPGWTPSGQQSTDSVCTDVLRDQFRPIPGYQRDHTVCSRFLDFSGGSSASDFDDLGNMVTINPVAKERSSEDHFRSWRGSREDSLRR